MWMRRCKAFPTSKPLTHRSWLGRAIRLQSSDALATTSISPAVIGRARRLTEEHGRLTKKLDTQYDAEIAKKAGALSVTATSFRAWVAANNAIADLQQLINDPSNDVELRSLAKEELSQTTKSLSDISSSLKAAIVPAHPFAQLPCLIELRPGAGGDEASLFAGDLLRMYQAYCKNNNLQHTVLSLETAASVSEDRVLEAILEITTPNSYDLLRCEAGVHRVQRVPATDSKGRTHTSAVSVLVLPSFPIKEEENSENNSDDPESDYYVNPRDVRTDTMRASGAGGQHVNMTDSAVRLTHIPTGTVVSMQTSRSQHKNRDDAWRLLRSRLAQARREAREEEMANLRTSVIGVSRTGRGDKVRTYNWGQQRVTDHRSGITLNRLDDVLKGGQSLNEVMETVRDWMKGKEVEVMIADEEAAAKRERKKK